MNPEAKTPATPGGGASSRRAHQWLSRSLWVLLGVAVGTAGYRLWDGVQESRRAARAQTRAAALLASIEPRAAARLEQTARQLQDLQSDVTRAASAARAEQIELARYRVRQKRAELLIEEVEGLLRRVATFGERAPGLYRLSPDRDIMGRDSSDRLAGLQAQAELLRQELAVLGPELEAVRERRAQLAVAETEAARRENAVAQAQSHEARESNQGQWEGVRPAPIEDSPKPSTELLQRLLAEAASSPWMEPVRSAPWWPAGPQIRYVPAMPYNPHASLVIGSSYPDRFIGYRDLVRYGPYPWFFRPPPARFWCW